MTILERDDPGHLSAMPDSSVVGAELTRPTLRDEDGVRNARWDWQLSRDNGNSWAQLDGGSASLTLPVAAAGNLVRARVTYDDRHGADKLLTSAAVPVSAVTASFDISATYWYPERLNISPDQPVSVLRAVFANLQPGVRSAIR